MLVRDEERGIVTVIGEPLPCPAGWEERCLSMYGNVDGPAVVALRLQLVRTNSAPIKQYEDVVARLARHIRFTDSLAAMPVATF